MPAARSGPWYPAIRDGMFFHVFGDGRSKSDWVPIRRATKDDFAEVDNLKAKRDHTTYGPGVSPPSNPNSPPTVNAPPTVPKVPGDTDGDGRIDPFFRPDDLASQANFWAQWNGTFAELDRQLGDLKTQTDYDRTQISQRHVENKAAIDEGAVARGVYRSSIRDGDQAQEQTNYTRADQLLTDKLNNLEGFIKGQKTNFETTTLPTMQGAWAGKKVENASQEQSAWDAAHPPAAPAQTAPKPPTTQAGIIAAKIAARGPIVSKPVINGILYHVHANGERIPMGRAK